MEHLAEEGLMGRAPYDSIILSQFDLAIVIGDKLTPLIRIIKQSQKQNLMEVKNVFSFRKKEPVI